MVLNPRHSSLGIFYLVVDASNDCNNSNDAGLSDWVAENNSTGIR